LKEELENHFSVLSYKLNEFSDENKKSFLINYWKNNSDETPNLEKKADKVLKKIASSIKEKDIKITGIPLQLKLIAEIYANEINIDDDFLNVKILYEKFMKKKFDIYWSKQKSGLNINNHSMKNFFENNNFSVKITI
jgi:hypothetical protein